MRIASQPIPSIPARVPDPAKPLRQPNANLPGSLNHLPLGGPIYGVTAFGAANPLLPVTEKVDPKQVTEAVLRLVSNRIAEHYGHNAMLAKNIIWLCFDLKKLRDKMQEPGRDKGELTFQAAGVLSDLLSTAALVPKLDAAEGIGARIDFIAEIGETTHRGTALLSLSDISKIMPPGAADASTKDVLDVLSTLGLRW